MGLTLLLALTAALNVSDLRSYKLSRLAVLEEVGFGGELNRYLVDLDPGVRRRAALAAARSADRRYAAGLLTQLADREPAVRAMAAFALGLMGERRAGTQLAGLLEDHDPIVRARAAEALGRLGDAAQAAKIADFVLRAVPAGGQTIAVRGDRPGDPNDPWLELRLGLFALARLKESGALARVLLSDGRPRLDWWAAAYAAASVRDPALAPLLRQLASSSDPLTRAFAAEGLGGLGGEASVAPLLKLLKDREPSVILHAIEALGHCGDSQATSQLAELLASPSASVKQQTLEALSSLPAQRGLLGKILGDVASSDADIRAAAMTAVAHIDGEQLILVLSGLDLDPAPSVRVALAQALAGTRLDVGTSILFSMLKDEEPRVAAAALAALQQARGAEISSVLIQQLNHPAAEVRGAAMRGLLQIDDAQYRAELSDCYRRSLSDRDAGARLALVSALGGNQKPWAVALLREAASKDPAGSVRSRAAALLSRRGEIVAESVRGLERPFLDYRGAMSVYAPLVHESVYTPRVILHTNKGRVEIYLDVVDAPWSAQSLMTQARQCLLDGQSITRVNPGASVLIGPPPSEAQLASPGMEVGERSFGRGSVYAVGDEREVESIGFLLEPAPHFDGVLTQIGWVASGMEVLDTLRPGDVVYQVEVWDGR